jgi:TolB protein
MPVRRLYGGGEGLVGTRLTISLVAAALVIGTSGCGGGDGKGEAPGFLEVDPSTPILQAITHLDAGDVLKQAEISSDAEGNRVVRTKLEIVFHSNVTAGDVHRVLDAFQATPTAAVKGTRAIVVRVPDPGSLPGLDDLIAGIKSDPAVWFVAKSVFPVLDEPPPGYPSPPDEVALSKLDHHLAVGAHGAWALRTQIQAVPKVVFMDFFGDGVPNGDFDVEVQAGDFSTAGLGDEGYHGYQVVGILAGRFGGVGERGLVTGMMPGTVTLRVVDLLDPVDPRDAEDRLVSRMQELAAGSRAVASTSLGVSDADLLLVRDLAVVWIEKVRAAGLEDRILHFTSAGNRGAGMDARGNSIYAAAALRDDLVDATTGARVAPLTNTLVIENAINSQGVLDYTVPKCLNESSCVGGHLAAIGTNVHTFADANTAVRNGGGTSSATPQAAGLAAYLWALRPDLGVQEVKDILLATATPVPFSADEGCSLAISAPCIDAYAAVLALDQHEGLDGGDTGLASMRLALLDIADDSGSPGGDGRFTETDLDLWIEKLVLDVSVASPMHDFSRFDLNGDGFTGGPRRAFFDLDIDDPVPAHGVALRTIEGRQICFNEESLTDLEIVGYYAYSSLYQGDTDARREILHGCFGQVAFVRADQTSAHICLMNHDGSDVVQITTGRSASSPSWSPDGRRIAFRGFTVVGGSATAYEIEVVNADGTGRVNLTNHPSLDMDPSWSPDGTKIAFASNRDGDFEIYVMNADGTNPVRLTNSPGPDQGPDWSPDGTQIAFHSTRGGAVRIYAMNADGTNPTQLADQSGVLPDWSPDGSRIAFQGIVGSTVQLFVMNADGSNLSMLTEGEDASRAHADWSPGGLTIVYKEVGGGVESIRSICMDGSDSTPVVLGSYPGASEPAWRP